MRKQPYIIDTHCDVLYKMFHNQDHSLFKTGSLDLSLEGMKHSSYLLQCFAIFIPSRVPSPSMKEVRTYAELFEKHILSLDGVVPVRTRQDLVQLQKGKQIGAMLTMEGADALQADLKQLEEVYNLGVRCLGLTWNYANWAADGVLEPRQAALSLKGRKLIQACNEIGMIIDISHLNEPGFWEVMELSSKPVIASHSNVHEICPHPRNLKKEQLEAIIQTDGRIGVTYVPQFTKPGGEKVQISDLLNHIEAICALGGMKHVGLGSDFDGISSYIEGLENAFHASNLADEIYRLYSASTAEDILWRNWHRFFEQHLQESSDVSSSTGR